MKRKLLTLCVAGTIAATTAATVVYHKLNAPKTETLSTLSSPLESTISEIEPKNMSVERQQIQYTMGLYSLHSLDFDEKYLTGF